MSPVERLQAAIKKLERLRDESGSFKQWNGGDFQDVTYEDGHRVGTVGSVTISMWDGSEQNPDDGTWRDSSAVLLMQTLHRTIDAQLELLRAGWNTIAGTDELPDGKDPKVWYGRSAAAALALADAILGSDQ